MNLGYILPSGDKNKLSVKSLDSSHVYAYNLKGTPKLIIEMFLITQYEISGAPNSKFLIQLLVDCVLLFLIHNSYAFIVRCLIHLRIGKQ
jgi:hypothetical protein